MPPLSALLFPVCAALSLAAADFFLKLASSRLSSSITTLIYALCTFIVPIVWVGIAKWRGEEFLINRDGILPAVLAGIAFSLVVVFLSLTFAAGVNLSIGTPAIRTLGIVLAATLGIVVFNEGISLRYVLGFALSLSGIYLIVTR